MCNGQKDEYQGQDEKLSDRSCQLTLQQSFARSSEFSLLKHDHDVPQELNLESAGRSVDVSRLNCDRHHQLNPDKGRILFCHGKGWTT